MSATTSKTPQKPVALVVSQGWDQEGNEIGTVFSCEGGKDGVAVPSSVVTSPISMRSELDWCLPYLCRGTVEIDGVTYPVTQRHNSRCARM